MRRWIVATLATGLVLAACDTTPPAAPRDARPLPPSAPASSLQPGTFRFTPKNESTNVGPVGTGLARCGLYVYAWSPADKACKVQVNHCEATREGSDEVRCMSLADERTLRCGAKADACGQEIECACPAGDAEAVQDAPGTVHVTPTAIGQRFKSTDQKCEAKVTKLPGGDGPAPAPCILALHDCAGPGPCIDRTEMLSCGIRSDVCSRPVKCECP